MDSKIKIPINIKEPYLSREISLFYSFPHGEVSHQMMEK